MRRRGRRDHLGRAGRGVLLLQLGLFGCGSECSGEGQDEAVCADRYDYGMAPCPYRDEWRVEFDAAVSGPLDRLEVSGEEIDANFRLRGDVEVHFDGEAGRIHVEARRSTSATDLENAETSWAKMHIWSRDGEPVSPGNEASGDDCSQDFHEGCTIRPYYDGLQQPARDSVDLRITLPPGSVGELVITTSDNAIDEAYPNRGDVIVDGLEGSATIMTGSGRTVVTLGPNPVGSLSVLSRGAGDVSVFSPAGAWIEGELRNEHPDGNSCAPEVYCATPADCELIDEEPGFPWKLEFEAYAQSTPDAYSVELASSYCDDVDRVEGPEDWGMIETTQEGHTAVVID